MDPVNQRQLRSLRNYVMPQISRAVFVIILILFAAKFILVIGRKAIRYRHKR